MSLTITNDSVQSAFFGADGVSVIKYGRDRVWPNKMVDSPYLFVDASERARVHVGGKQDDLRFSRDGETFNKPTGDNPDVWFGGEDGPVWMYGIGDGIRGFQNTVSDVPYIVGGSLACARGESDSYAGKSYAYFFDNCKMYDASMLRFPDSYGDDFSAKHMFENCHELKRGPSLPSPVLTPECYEHMFYQCDALEEMPEIKAVDIPMDACHGMFEGCTSLRKVDLSSIKTVSYQGMCEMFKGSGVEEVEDFNFTTIGDHGCAYMFADCSRLVVAPKFPKVQVAKTSALIGAFSGCSSLRRVSILVPLDEEHVLEDMCDGCTSLEYAALGKAGKAGHCSLAQTLLNCTALKEVHFYPTMSVAGFWPDVFYGQAVQVTHSADVYIPASAVDVGRLKIAVAGYNDPNITIHYE